MPHVMILIERYSSSLHCFCWITVRVAVLFRLLVRNGEVEATALIAEHRGGVAFQRHANPDLATAGPRGFRQARTVAGTSGAPVVIAQPSVKGIARPSADVTYKDVDRSPRRRDGVCRGCD